MGPDLDTLATALYVRIDDLLAQNPGWAPRRPVVGFAPKLSDAELAGLAVCSALLGFDNESQFVRFARAHLGPWFPYLPNRDGYNKRLRRSGEMIAGVMGWLARECESWHHDVWLVDSTPVECGTSRETRKRSDLADGPNTAGARRIRGTSGVCVCTLSPPRQGCGSRSRSPARKPTSAKSAPT